MKQAILLRLTLALVGASAALYAQGAANRVTVPFSDPSRPRTVTGNMMQGCFVVEGYDGKDVIIEPRGSGERSEHHTPRGAEGLKRIEPMGLGMTVEEENNTVHIHSS